MKKRTLKQAWHFYWPQWGWRVTLCFLFFLAALAPISLKVLDNAILAYPEAFEKIGVSTYNIAENGGQYEWLGHAIFAPLFIFFVVYSWRKRGYPGKNG